MSWQDIVIAVCQFAFLPSMLPTILGREKPALSTSIMNFVLVSVITLTLFTLKLWLSVVSGAMIALIWLILAIQQWQIRKKSS
ncbi:hypothetical protein H6801_03845 [Candidatus Nomurabacteria bacterium]|jgi:D-alanyl-lipoteichoic acid acyltransferase DltB (MBOAT superfamily)|nr:hypothetical protein [Candidatus Nomurabacteria bacterium]